MEDISRENITAFDTFFTNDHIRMLKILLPFLKHSIQKNIAVYIKYREFEYVFQYFKSPHSEKDQNSCLADKYTDFDLDNVLDALLPYCSDPEKKQFMQLKNLLRTMHDFRDMMEMINTIKELFPEGIKNDAGSDPDFFSVLSNLFENNTDSSINDLFQMFQGGTSS